MVPWLPSVVCMLSLAAAPCATTTITSTKIIPPLLVIPILTCTDNITSDMVAAIETSALPALHVLPGFQRACFIRDHQLPTAEIFVFLEWSDFHSWEASRGIVADSLVNASQEAGCAALSYFDDQFDGFRTVLPPDRLALSALNWVCPSNATLETLRHAPIKAGGMRRFLAADAATWTAFLRGQDGFVAKDVLVRYWESLDAGTVAYSMIHWASLEQWKAIPGPDLANTEEQFQEANGYEVPVKAFPSSEDGFACAL